MIVSTRHDISNVGVLHYLLASAHISVKSNIFLHNKSTSQWLVELLLSAYSSGRLPHPIREQIKCTKIHLFGFHFNLRKQVLQQNQVTTLTWLACKLASEAFRTQGTTRTIPLEFPISQWFCVFCLSPVWVAFIICQFLTGPEIILIISFIYLHSLSKRPRWSGSKGS